MSFDFSPVDIPAVGPYDIWKGKFARQAKIYMDAAGKARMRPAARRRMAMLEVAFSESAKGSIKCAQHCGGDPVENPAIGLILRNGVRPSPKKEKEMLEKARREQFEREHSAVPLGGSPEDVFGLSFALSVGDIAAPLESGPRRDLLFRMASENWPDEAEKIRESAEEGWRRSLADLENLKQRAEAGEPVRIWYDFTPDGMCGLLFAASQLKKAAGRVSAVHLPLWESRGDTAVQRTSWSEVAPEEFGGYLSLEQELPRPVRDYYFARRWEELRKENAPLRAFVNGCLRSADERFYDGFIRAAVPEGDFSAGKLTGAVLGRLQLRIGDWFVARRIRVMIAEGFLQVVQKSEHPYETILRATVSPSA